MLKKQNKNQRAESGVVLHVNLLGAIVFSLALVIAAAMVTYALANHNHPELVAGKEIYPTGGPAPLQIPPWGELVVRDIKLKPPEEYLAFEAQHITPPAWNFDGTSIDRVRQLMLSSRLTQEQVNGALASAKVSKGAIMVIPSNNLVLSLSAQTRAKLYHELGRNNGNEHMRFPFCYAKGEFEEAFSAEKVSPASVELVKKLLYARGDLQCFSDYELVLLQINDKAEQMRLLSALSSQSAVMAGVRIRPDTDIDKLLGYWAWPGGIKIKDVQPLLDSLKGVPDGRLGLVYLLPQFARQRLYTFPMPSRPGDVTMDCHWSTMNFFNDVPDDHFTDPAYTVNYLEKNYYQIATPTKYGDIILFLDGDSNNAIHSAVYLADDLVFTKNGNNMSQPWMIMHLKDLTMKYESDGPGRMVVYRNRSW
jgi:hypothetical protein